MDYHVLDTSKNIDRINCVFHLTIPNTNNFVGISHRQIILDVYPDRQSQLSQIEQWEQDLLNTGELQEVTKTVLCDANLSKGAKMALVEQAYIEADAEVENMLNNLYDFYGFQGNAIP